jgi:hypothetical protein
MNARSRDIPAPDMDGTDPDEVLRRRFLNTQVGHTPPTPAHTPTTPQVQTGKGTTSGTRPDPDGMKRISLYVTEAAATGLGQAADDVLATLGGDVPRHVALSALLNAAAKQAPAIAQELIQQRATELTERLKALHDQQNPT